MVTPRCGQQWGQASTHHSAVTHGVLLPSPFSAADRLRPGEHMVHLRSHILVQSDFFFFLTFLLPRSGLPPWQHGSIGFSRSTWRFSVWKHLPPVFCHRLPRGVAQAWLCLRPPLCLQSAQALVFCSVAFWPLLPFLLSWLHLPLTRTAWTLC